MTGLDPDEDVILEVHCYVTDGQLNLVDEQGWGCVVHCPEARLALMDDWCTRTHGESGLVEEVLRSTVTVELAADGLYRYITRWVPEKRRALLAGNTVHMDANFLRKEPWRKIIDHLHYRIVDVSTLKEVALRWCSQSFIDSTPAKSEKHRAKRDIIESIREAKHYQDLIKLGSCKWEDIRKGNPCTAGTSPTAPATQ